MMESLATIWRSSYSYI